jgi:hypothetical protein
MRWLAQSPSRRGKEAQLVPGDHHDNMIPPPVQRQIGSQAADMN